MLYFAHKLLNEDKVKSLKKRLIISPDWVDGTASAKSSQVKRNLQLNTGEEKINLSKEIINIIEEDTLIKSFAFPSKIFNILFTRTGIGMYYGPHVDTPYLPTGRRDLSFTIFLSQPDEYKGGELILYIPPEKKRIKMNIGDIIIYPTKYLHEVKEVTEGERMVCVGWIESQIAREEDRDSLYLMRKGILEIMQKYGNSSAIQDLNLSYNNIYKRFLN